MRKPFKFFPEIRVCAVRMVQEHRGEYPSLWANIESIAPEIRCVPQFYELPPRMTDLDKPCEAAIFWIYTTESNVSVSGLAVTPLHF